MMSGDGSIRQGQAECDFFTHQSQCAGGELSASRDVFSADAALQKVKLDSHCFELWSGAAIVGVMYGVLTLWKLIDTGGSNGTTLSSAQ